MSSLRLVRFSSSFCVGIIVITPFIHKINCGFVDLQSLFMSSFPYFKKLSEHNVRNRRPVHLASDWC
jgi:hypothetical protein